MSRRREIHGCDDCPHTRYFGGMCEHPDAPADAPDWLREEPFVTPAAPPEWCPLRPAGELLVVVS